MPRRPHRPLAWVLAALAGLLAAPAWAGDDDRVRPYVGIRVGVSTLLQDPLARGIESQSTQQITGLSFGVNLGRYLGLELAGDTWETDLRLPADGQIGEYGVFALVPQVRLRYPLLDGRLTPYAIGGVGVAFSQFNDRKPPGFGRSIEADDAGLVGTLGGGIEYFLADNVALGAEVRWLVAQEHDIEVDGQTRSADLDALLTSLHLRVFLGGDPPPAARPPRPRGRYRGYLGFRVGGGAQLIEDIGPGLSADSENSALGPLNLLIGAVMGVDIGRHLSLELAAEGHEINVRARGLGTVGELSMYALTPQVRLRYPLLDGRLVPYVVGGVGVGYAEANDLKAPSVALEIKGKDFAPIASVGVGLDWFFADNLSVGVETRYRYSRDHEFEVGTRTEKLDLDAILTTIGLTIHFP